MSCMTAMPIRDEAKQSALLELRPCAESFILRKAPARQCLNYFKQFPENAVKKQKCVCWFTVT